MQYIYIYICVCDICVCVTCVCVLCANNTENWYRYISSIIIYIYTDVPCGFCRMLEAPSVKKTLHTQGTRFPLQSVHGRGVWLFKRQPGQRFWASSFLHVVVKPCLVDTE